MREFPGQAATVYAPFKQIGTEGRDCHERHDANGFARCRDLRLESVATCRSDMSETLSYGLALAWLYRVIGG